MPNNNQWYAVSLHAAQCVSALMGLVTLTFDRLTLKLICKSHLGWGTFIPNMDTLGVWVLDMYHATDTDRQMDGETKAMLIVPSLWAGA